MRKIENARTAMITGWAMDLGAIYRYQCDAAFPLSDHADFPDLLRFVEAVKPKRVLTLHGFAREFAQTLRERGVEAWAIGEDNQLELGMLTASPSNSSGDATPSSRLTNPGDEGVAAPVDAGGVLATPRCAASAQPTSEAFARFVEVADAVKATPKKLEKIALLQAYLAILTPDDAANAATFFTGRSFPQTDQRNLTLGWAVIKRAVLEVAGATEADLYAAYHRYADTGEAAAAVLTQRKPGPPGQGSGESIEWSLSDISTFFERVAASRGPAPKLELLRERLSVLSPTEAKYLIKIITGDLRIGLKEGLLEEAIAAASGQPLEAVREANMLSGDIAAVARAARTNELSAIQLTVFHPLQFMLASPEPTAQAIVDRMLPTEEGALQTGGATPPVVGAALRRDESAPSRHKAAPTKTIWLEEKYDGIRCQVHKATGRVEFYSRDLNRITGQFPDLARAAQNLPGDFIADGELLAWREGRALPFAELQKRLGRKGDDFFLGAEIPVSLSFYDLLWLNGRALLKEPLSVRRTLLAQLLAQAGVAGDATPSSRSSNPGDVGVAAPVQALPFVLAPVQQVSTAAEIEAAFLAARRRGNEGLMAKDPKSFYTPGRRGLAWLKLKKAYATLDVVVVGVEYGHGKRRDVLSDYTFAIRDEQNDNRLLTVGKAYSGLTDMEIARLTQHFLDHTTEVHGRFRTVVPDTVLEIAFDIIQPSSRHQSGYALRFPRIARIRTDKTPAEIDTLETCRRLAEGNAFAPTKEPPPSEVAAPVTERCESETAR